MTALNWIRDHWAAITSIAVALSSLLATIKQQVDQKTHPHGWFDVFIDLLALTPRLGSIGILGPLNLPLVPSLNKIDKDTGAAAIHASRAAAHAERAALEANKAVTDADKAGAAEGIPPSEPVTASVVRVDELETNPHKLLALLIPFLFASLFGCAHFNFKKAAFDVGTCATPVVLKEVENLAGTVSAILVGGAADWSDQLTALETMGAPFVVCAVRAVVADMRDHLPPAPFHGQIDPKISSAIGKGQGYLALRGVL